MMVNLLDCIGCAGGVTGDNEFGRLCQRIGFAGGLTGDG